MCHFTGVESPPEGLGKMMGSDGSDFMVRIENLYSFLVRENLVFHRTYVRFLGFFILLGVPGVLVVRIFIFNYPKTVVFVAIIVSFHAARN